jgi:ADP-heptose:LPS heptosyltransferase
MNLNRALDYLAGVPLVWLLGRFRREPSAALNSEPRKILVIKLAAVGDTVLLDHALTFFRKAHPSAEIHWLVSPINQALARFCPVIDRFFVWDRRAGSLPALIKSLRRERYDAVCDLEQWSRGTALLSYFTGAAVRVGFDTPGQHRAALFTRSYRKRFDRHEIDDFYETLALLGPLERDRALTLPVPIHQDELVNAGLSGFLNSEKRKVLIHPGCGSDGLPREWPLTSYAVLAHWLLKSQNAVLVLTSGPEETMKPTHLNKLLKGAALNVGGRLSWNGLIGLVAGVDLVISGNTGVMHIAAALGKRQVALHGPTNPLLWGPLNPRAVAVASPCPQCPCLKLGFEYHAVDQSCMALIDVETVKQAVMKALGDSQTK